MHSPIEIARGHNGKVLVLTTSIGDASCCETVVAAFGLLAHRSAISPHQLRGWYAERASKEDFMQTTRTLASASSFFLCVALLGACGQVDTNGAATVNPTSSSTNDPNLSQAAASIGPQLSQSFPATFAGIELDQMRHTIVIYRKPDTALDSYVKEHLSSVSVEFRDAKFSLTTMQDAVKKVTGDIEYWKGRGVDIQTVTPTPDGSSVEIGTPQAGAAATMIEDRYPGIVVKVVERTLNYDVAKPTSPWPSVG
jgi:hypothetical protein